jgi:hypothetical protein
VQVNKFEKKSGRKWAVCTEEVLRAKRNDGKDVFEFRSSIDNQVMGVEQGFVSRSFPVKCRFATG